MENDKTDLNIKLHQLLVDLSIQLMSLKKILIEKNIISNEDFDSKLQLESELFKQQFINNIKNV